MKAIKSDRKGHYKILKGSIQQEYINLVNIYVPNTGAPRYIKKILVDFREDMNNDIA